MRTEQMKNDATSKQKVSSTSEQMKLHPAVVGAVWWWPYGEGPPPGSEAPPVTGWTGRTVQIQMERSGRSLMETTTRQTFDKCDITETTETCVEPF